LPLLFGLSAETKRREHGVLKAVVNDIGNVDPGDSML
jgi:hypothetical protein